MNHSGSGLIFLFQPLTLFIFFPPEIPPFPISTVVVSISLRYNSEQSRVRPQSDPKHSPKKPQANLIAHLGFPLGEETESLTMAVHLTPNAISAILAGDTNSKPIVQVLEINNILKQDRYRLVISDGVSTQHAVLATQLNDAVKNGLVKQGSVVQLLEYFCNLVQNRKSVSL